MSTTKAIGVRAFCTHREEVREVMAVTRLAFAVAVVLLCIVSGGDAVHSASVPVPILAWSNRDTFSSVSAEIAGDDKADVESLVQGSKFKDLGFVFVFRTEKLSFEDIAKYGSAYDDSKAPCALTNIKGEMDDAVSSIWTGTGESAASLLIDEIALKLDMGPKFISGMEDVAVIFGQPQLLVIDLPYGDSEEEYAQQDAMVAEVLEAVHHLDTAYAAFYTAMTTKSLQDAMVRPLLAKRDAPSQPLKSSSTMCPVSYGVRDSDGSYCALLCLRNTTIFYWESQTDLEKGETPCVANIIAFDQKSVSGCNSSTIGPYASIFATVQGNCSDDNDNHDDEDDVAMKFKQRTMEIEIEFTFPRGEFELEGQWTLQEGSWQMMMIVGPFNLSRHDDNKLPYPFSIPIGLSYSCQTDSTATTTTFSNPNRFVQLNNDTQEVVVAEFDGQSPVVQFTGIQVQAYGSATSEGDGAIFSTVYDCNGYMTLPSIMGVFCIIIVIIVLYIANVAAFSAKTIDLFEDPRAPAISIENLH